MKFLLNTHALVWLLSSNCKGLPIDIRESIIYCEDVYFVSEISLIEIIQLQQGKKIDLKYSPSTIRDIIEQNNIMILPVTEDILDKFYTLPIPVINGSSHSDPFDRLIISTALRRGLTLISADMKFPWYEEHCKLQLRKL